MVPIPCTRRRDTVGDLLDSLISEVLEEDPLSIKSRIMRACGIRVPDMIFTPESRHPGGSDGPRFFCIPNAHVFSIDELTTHSSSSSNRPRRTHLRMPEYKELAMQYLKLCSLAFLFEINNDCALDKHGSLFMINLSPATTPTIFPNTGIFTTSMVRAVVEDVLFQLDKLEEFEVLSNLDKLTKIARFKRQLTVDKLEF